jgi:predicted metal-dependent RNase
LAIGFLVSSGGYSTTSMVTRTFFAVLIAGKVRFTYMLLVGYQAQGTLGYQLANHARKIKIFGLVHEPKFTVRMMHHFSAHADRDDLTWFITSLAPRPRKIFLVHGDSDDRQAFAEHLKDVGVDRVALPNFRDEVELA